MVDDSKNKIEDLKMNLYNPENKMSNKQREGVLHQVRHDVLDDWKEETNEQTEEMKNKSKKPKTSIFKKFFIFAVIFFVGALGYALYNFYISDSSVSSDKIDIKVIGNSFTKGGDELPLQIEITNNNNSNLELADLVVEYPKGADDNIADVVRLPRDDIGTIRPGENIIRNIKVKLYGGEKSIRNIKVSLEYHPEGSNAIFTKDKYYPVTISMAPLSLSIESPTTTISNQPVSFKIISTLNTSLPSDNPILQVTYPNNFIFESATPAPILGNSVWDLSTLTTLAPLSVEIKGKIVGEDGDEQVFHAYSGTASDKNPNEVGVVYSSVLQKILIAEPFLSTQILVNNINQNEYVVSGSEDVEVAINWANNLSTSITDTQIIASLSGNVFDKNNVEARDGFYDSANNQITWNKSTDSRLSEIVPGESGSVSFNFKPISLVGVSSTVKDPQVLIKVSIKGRQPILGSTYTDVDNFSEKVVKILSTFQIASSASYSSGNMPPKAETETVYKVTWTLSNTSNNVSQASARAVLPIYVKWGGGLSGSKENVTYNEVSREVIWNIGSVSPYVGINSNREVTFLISLKPSISQIKSIPTLMNEIKLTGMDMYTNTTINNTYRQISTALPNDPDATGRVSE
mgnify:CR=1 FL=1